MLIRRFTSYLQKLLRQLFVLKIVRYVVYYIDSISTYCELKYRTDKVRARSPSTQLRTYSKVQHSTLAVDTYQLLSCFADLEPKIAFSRVRKRSYCNCVFAIGPCQNRPARPAVKAAAAAGPSCTVARGPDLRLLVFRTSTFCTAASLGIVLQNFILRVGYQLCNCCEKNAKLHWARQSAEAASLAANPRSKSHVPQST